jgi:hypothetical protein
MGLHEKVVICINLVILHIIKTQPPKFYTVIQQRESTPGLGISTGIILASISAIYLERLEKNLLKIEEKNLVKIRI